MKRARSAEPFADILPPRGARFTAVPPAIKGFGTFPVRAYAEYVD